MMRITSCHDLLDYLSEYVDGELENQALCEEIESHLADCEDCKVVVDTLEKTVYLYREAAKNAVTSHAVTEHAVAKNAVASHAVTEHAVAKNAVAEHAVAKNAVAEHAVAEHADSEVSTMPADVRDRLFSRLDLGEFLD